MADYSLVPVDHQPDFENFSLVPVDHDPFADDGVSQQGQSAPVQVQVQPALHAQQALGQQVQNQQPTMGTSQTNASYAPTTQPPGSSNNSITAGTNDFFRSIPRGIVSGFNTAASALGRATQAEMGQDVDAPTPEQATDILEKNVTGPLHRPEGRAGQFGASVGEFIGNPASYLVPGSVPFKVGAAALGGLGSEAGGQLGEGTPLEVPLRIFGGLLGGLGAARLAAGTRAAQALAPAAEEAGAGFGNAAENAPTGNFYSVLYEAKLQPKSYPGLRRAHNREAAESLLQDMASDSAFAQDLENQGVVLQRTPTGLAPREPPSGFSWHHGDEPGTMQLVPRQQHDPGSIFQGILHPGGRGGYSKWGK